MLLVVVGVCFDFVCVFGVLCIVVWMCVYLFV